MVSAVAWMVSEALRWGLTLVDVRAAADMILRHYVAAVVLAAVIAVPPVIVLRRWWSGLTPVYREAITEVCKLVWAVPKWAWSRVSATATGAAGGLVTRARASRATLELAVTTTASGANGISALSSITTSGQSTPLLTSDADDTAADASTTVFGPSRQQVVAPVTRVTFPPQSAASQEIAALNECNARARAFTAERDESLRAATAATAVKSERGVRSTQEAHNTASVVPRETTEFSTAHGHTYGGDRHLAPIDVGAGDERPGAPRSSIGEDSDARERRAAPQTVSTNSRYKVEKPKQLESNSDLELWWSRFKDYATWAGATPDTVKSIMMPLLGDSVHKRVEMVIKHKIYTSYDAMYEDVEKAFGGRRIPLRMLEHYFVNRYQFEDETLQSYYADLLEFGRLRRRATYAATTTPTAESRSCSQTAFTTVSREAPSSSAGSTRSRRSAYLGRQRRFSRQWRRFRNAIGIERRTEHAPNSTRQAAASRHPAQQNLALRALQITACRRQVAEARQRTATQRWAFTISTRRRWHRAQQTTADAPARLRATRMKRADKRAGRRNMVIHKARRAR